MIVESCCNQCIVSNGLGSNTNTLILGAGTTGAEVAAPIISSAVFGATAPAWAVPVIGAAIASVTIAIVAWRNRKRPRQKIATTQIVNEAEPLLAANRDAFLSTTVKTSADKAQALANFDDIWDTVVSLCSDKDLGPPGQWCVNDRIRGGKWDWFAYYRDPIEAVETSSMNIPFIGGMEMGTLLPLGLIGLGMLVFVLGGRN